MTATQLCLLCGRDDHPGPCYPSNSMRPHLIAFAGYSRAGKDEAAKPLIAAGWRRFNFGDMIKAQLEELVWFNLKFSAFTDATAQKSQIRRTLEAWGEDNYENISRDYFEELDFAEADGERIVNTRLLRLAEAREWKERGGVIYWIINHRVGAFSAFEDQCLNELLADSSLIDGVIHNDGSVAELHEAVRLRFNLPAQT